MQQLLFAAVLIIGILFSWALILRERHQKEKAKSFRLNQENMKIKATLVIKDLYIGELEASKNHLAVKVLAYRIFYRKHKDGIVVENEFHPFKSDEDAEEFIKKDILKSK